MLPVSTSAVVTVLKQPSCPGLSASPLIGHVCLWASSAVMDRVCDVLTRASSIAITSWLTRFFEKSSRRSPSSVSRVTLQEKEAASVSVSLTVR